jgi:hypothetical protein
MFVYIIGEFIQSITDTVNDVEVETKLFVNSFVVI